VRRDGLIPGAKHVPRSVLEWRADQTSEWRDPELGGRRLVVVCSEGCSSSLAAALLVDLGVDAGDLDGGFRRWVAEGFPVE
jgi:rhodanese-related sulfurtransferase